MKKYVKLRNFIILEIFLMSVLFYLYVIVIFPQIKSACVDDSCVMAKCDKCEIKNNQKVCDCIFTNSSGEKVPVSCTFKIN